MFIAKETKFNELLELLMLSVHGKVTPVHRTFKKQPGKLLFIDFYLLLGTECRLFPQTR